MRVEARMDAPVTIEAARASDAALISALGRRVYAAHFASLWTADGLRRYLDAQYDEAMIATELGGTTTRYALARCAGETLGFMKLIHERPSPIGGERGALLDKVYLDSSTTGRGIGAQLIAEAERLARERGDRLLWLDVLRSNDAAARLYARLGFVEVGQLPFATDLGEIGFRVMHKALL
jgi:ribosomal protein S18 acetylase RimI-like enzyme